MNSFQNLVEIKIQGAGCTKILAKLDVPASDCLYWMLGKYTRLFVRWFPLGMMTKRVKIRITKVFAPTGLMRQWYYRQGREYINLYILLALDSFLFLFFLLFFLFVDLAGFLGKVRHKWKICSPSKKKNYLWSIYKYTLHCLWKHLAYTFAYAEWRAQKKMLWSQVKKVFSWTKCRKIGFLLQQYGPSNPEFWADWKKHYTWKSQV